METEKKLELLLKYYYSTRNAGHTTLMKEGINHFDKDFFVLSMHSDDYRELEIKPQELISLQNLDKLIGHKKPMVIDNGAMIELLSDALMRIEALNEEIKTLEEIKRVILIKDVLRETQEKS